MKGAIAIVIGLSAVLLAVTVAGESVKYSRSIIGDKVLDQLLVEVKHCGKLADKYLEEAKTSQSIQLLKTKKALASRLMTSVGSIRYTDITNAVMNTLEGKDYGYEMGVLKSEVYKIDTQVDEKLQALVKLADEIPDSTILKDVQDVIEGIEAYTNFINDLLNEEPPQPLAARAN